MLTVKDRCVEHKTVSSPRCHSISSLACHASAQCPNRSAIARAVKAEKAGKAGDPSPRAEDRPTFALASCYDSDLDKANQYEDAVIESSHQCDGYTQVHNEEL